MDMIEQARMEADAADLEEDISKEFGKFNVNAKLKWFRVIGNRIIFSIKTKGNTREIHVRANAPEVQRKLKLPLFHVVKYDFNLYLIVSREQAVYSHLPDILNSPSCRGAQAQMCLPHIVGHDVLGGVVMDDLVHFPHLLLGGSTGSGKSVGLQALITSIAYSKSPSRVNFVLIDVGATSLMPFEELPHLSCSVVRDRMTAIQTMVALTAEMERRIDLEYADPAGFKRLPRLVVVIDEFPALFMGVGKSMVKELTNNVSNLLQRGRHAKIHMVLAAQNPTYLNMKVDLGNITARIAFKCAKQNFSETILDEGGAENLAGHGDLLLRSPRYDAPQRVQGIYITPKELRQTVQYIKTRYGDADSNKFNLVLPSNNLAGSSGALGDRLTCSVVRRWPPKADQQLADVILWALEHDSISINLLMKERQFGWNTASRLVSRLEELGIVGRPDGKLPRHVIPGRPEDLPEELMEFLESTGTSRNAVICAIYSR